MSNTIITLLTDFGESDYFVGSMKGIILSINKNITVVDISHAIEPFNIDSGAFVLASSYRHFPSGTVHLAVIDPGVGSSRRPILIEAGGFYFIGPDNGLFSFVVARETDYRAYHLNKSEYFRSEVSPTFHGRDIFAPVAGALSQGILPHEIGTEINDVSTLVKNQSLFPRRIPEDIEEGKHTQGALPSQDYECQIIHVDHFGNCITNFTINDLPADFPREKVVVIIGTREINGLRQFFSDDERETGQEFVYWGSSSHLEIGVNRGNAARHLGLQMGEKLIVRLKSHFYTSANLALLVSE
ncbi:MAG: SAM hydrolase/SAM-dependent halogenase family protein [Pyrinomonadaceae bacterium]